MVEVGNKPRFKHVIAMAPLIDVIFMLIIFFMFAGSLVRPNPFDVELPVATSVDQSPPATLVVDVSGFGELALNGEASSREKLMRRVGELVEASPDLEVIVRADAGATTGDLLTTLRDLSVAGVVSFRLAAQPRTAAFGG